MAICTFPLMEVRSNYYSTIIASCIISIIYIKIKFNSLIQVIA
jgi:hypothetical protein